MNEIDTTEYEHSGKTITIKWHCDDDSGPPWKNEDGHGPVSEWTRRSKAPGERVLIQDRGSYRYYDFAAAVALAIHDGWGAVVPGQTPGQQAAAAAERDYDYLRRWCNDNWHYVGFIVTIDGMDYHDSCCGYCSDDMAEIEAVQVRCAKTWIDRELKESQIMACADIATV